MAKKNKAKSPANRRSSSNHGTNAVNQLKRATAGGPTTTAAAAAAAGRAGTTWGTNQVKEGSRGQRKRLKSKQRAVSRKLVIEKVQKHFKVHKHGEALGDVSSLAAALEVFSGKAPNPATNAKATENSTASTGSMGVPAKRMGNKRRAHLARAEVGLFKQVLAHPDFRANAVAAVQSHLKNTMMANKANE
jgi:hypothetical protein